MKSIMQDKDGTCYLCKKLEGDYSVKPVQEHHVVYGWANRRLSEKFGLKIYLCAEKHHEEGKYSVHKNPDIRQQLCAEAQIAFEQNYPDLSFREIFGKNWNYEKADKADNYSMREDVEDGFRFIPELIGEQDGNDRW